MSIRCVYWVQPVATVATGVHPCTGDRVSAPRLNLNPKPGDLHYAVDVLLSRTMVPTLVVGGETSFVVRKVAPRLFRHGLHMKGHWPYKKAKGAFPENIGALVVLTDMVGHAMSLAAIAEAEKRGIPVVLGIRKYAILEQRLRDAGFPEIPSLAPKPAVSEKKPKEVAPFVRPLLGPSPDAVNEYLPATTPSTETETDMTTSPSHSDTVVPLNGLRRDYSIVRDLYMAVVRENTDISNADAHRTVVERANALGVDPGGMRPDLLAAIRKELGIIRPKNSYLPKPVPPSLASGSPVAEVPVMVAALTTASSDTERQHSAPGDDGPYPSPAETSGQTIVRIHAREAVRPTPSQDVRELVQMLRTAMAAEGIERLTVTKDTVNFRRVVVEEGEYDV